MPKKDDQMGAGTKPQDMSDPKPAPPEKGMTDTKNEGASEAKPPSNSPPPQGGKDVEKGMEKPDSAKPQGGKDDPQGQQTPQGGKKGMGEGKKLDEQQQKELEDAVKNLDSPDPEKRKEAQDTLDKTLGKDERKSIEDLQKQRKQEFEQLKKDLDSSDKAKQDAAKKKLDDLMKQAEEQAKKSGDKSGKDLTQDEINDLMQKAQDLNSKDEKKRQEAEKGFDNKLGKDGREKLQDELKNNPPMDPKQQEELKKKLEEMAKKMPGRGKGPIDPKNEPAWGPPTKRRSQPWTTTREIAQDRATPARGVREEPLQQRTPGQTRMDSREDYDDFLKDREEPLKSLPRKRKPTKKRCGTQPKTPIRRPHAHHGRCGQGRRSQERHEWPQQHQRRNGRAARIREGQAAVPARGEQAEAQAVAVASSIRVGRAPSRARLSRFPYANITSRSAPLPHPDSVMSANRYLVSFDARNTFHRFTDVLVIGAGIAGLRAALEVPADLSVLVVTKDRVTESNSSYAQGGIAGVLSPEDRFENHVEDTLIAGDGLCDREVVEMVVREAPAEIDKLISWGTKFDEENGATRPHPRGRAQPPPHRPCPRRRDRLRGDAGHHRERPHRAERHDLGRHVHHRPAHPRRHVRRGRGRAETARASS